MIFVFLIPLTTKLVNAYPVNVYPIFVGALASTMLSTAEFICLRVAIARSSGRN